MTRSLSMMGLPAVLLASLLAGCASRPNNTTPTAGVARSVAASVAVQPTSGPAAAASGTPGGNSFPAIGGASPAAAAASVTPTPADGGARQPAAGPNNSPQAASGSASSTDPAASGGSSFPPSGGGSGSAPAAGADSSKQAPTATGNAAAATTPARSSPPSTINAGDIIDQVKLQAADLPSGFGVGGLEGFQANEQAVSGYNDPQAVLKQMQATGRAGGYIQQLTTPDAANGAGISIEVWKDAEGARQYFAGFPKPDASLQYQQIDVPGLADDVFAYRYTINGSTGYSIAWRRGRLILGVGELLGSGVSVDKVLEVAKLLDKKAQAAQQ